MNEKDDAINLAGATLPRSRHVCAFYRGAEEAYEIVLPFLKEGLERNEKVVTLINSRVRGDHLRRLQDFRIDTHPAELSGQLEVRGWDETYLRGGRFDQQAMVELLEGAIKSGRSQGYPLTRIMAAMEWSLTDYRGVSGLAAYEARLNYVLPKYPDPVVCMYDLSRYSASLVMDILRTHPTVIIGGMLQENPFYVPPDEFLLEFQARPAASMMH